MNTNKLQKLLFFLIIIFLPSQFGRHFWPEFAIVTGVKIDYFSPTLYLTDILILGLVICQIPLLLKNFIFDLKKLKKTLVIAGVLGILAIVNVSTSLSPAVSSYKWFKIIEIGFLAWFVATNVKTKASVTKIAALLLIPVLYEAVLVFWQFRLGASVGGLWWLLGERTFNSETPGIANTISNGLLVLRPYGTFSHPNVAAGFLAVVLSLIIWYFPQKYRRISAGIVAFGFGALLVTLSRSAIVVGASSVLVVLALKIRKVGLVLGIIGLGLVVVTFGFLRQGDESVEVREKLNRLAVLNFAHTPVFGTGLGTSPLYKSWDIKIANYALQNQPTHNSYLLVLGETGMVGFLLVVLVCWVATRKLVKERNFGLLTPLVGILVLGLFDHYFLTLQQGQVLLGLIFGLAFAKIDK